MTGRPAEAPARLEVVTDGAGVNEDLAGADPPFYWVLDGSTPLFGHTVKSSRSDAEWLVLTIDTWLRRNLADRTDFDPTRLIGSLARVLGREYKKEGVPVGPEGPSAALALVRVRTGAVDYAVLGDVTVVIRSRRRVEVVRDEKVTEFDRAAIEILTRELDAGATYDHAHRVLGDTLRSNRRYMNSQPGYWILTNRSRAARHAVAGTKRIAPGAEVLVMSDGFARVVDTFGLYRGWNGLLAHARKKSLNSALEALRAAERRDPQCRRFPRLSPFDDATALYLRAPPDAA
jgi:Protein phosphatase 2C